MIIEGKTKKVIITNSTQAIIIQKDDITAGDGDRRHIIPGKGEINAKTTANIFKFLNKHNINTHFINFQPPNHTTVKLCKMIPLEIVTRRYPAGSYKKKFPESNGPFKTLITEFFLKDDKNHDPQILLENVEKTIGHNPTILTTIATNVFTLLEKALNKHNITLVDMKIELGTHNNQLIIADEINNDHWRIWPDNNPNKALDKQIYRDNINHPDLNLIKSNYQKVAELTETFQNE